MPKPNFISASVLTALLLAPFGISGSASACELDEVSYTYAESECLSLLRTLRDPKAPGPQHVAEQIEGLGIGALETLFVVLETRALPDPLNAEGKSQVLSEPQTEAVLTAFDLFGRGNAFPVWQERYGAFLLPAEEEGADAQKNAANIPIQAAIQSLGGFGGAEELDLVWSLLKLDKKTKTKLQRTMRGTLVEAMVGILARDLNALPHLQRSWDVLPDAWMGSVIRAIGKNRDPRGNQLLMDLIQFSPNHGRLAASQVQVLGPTNDKRFNAELSGSLLEQLGSEAKEDVQAAILAVGVLEDESALPALIELLEDDRPGVPSNAAHALRSLTTMSLHPSTDVWNMWRGEELKWNNEEQRKTLARLQGRDPNIVKAALREIGRHRLNRHDLARKVVPLLMTNNVSVKLEAARVLGELGSRWGASDLVGSLQDSSEAVREAALHALRRITGRQFGPTPEEWEGMRFP